MNFKKLKNKIGKFIKYFLNILNIKVHKKIHIYGPIKMDAEYVFSKFSNWSKQHNDCFEYCIEQTKDSLYFIDVGAHIGLVTLSASSVMNPGSKLIAFEPATQNRTILKKNIRMNRAKLKSEIIIEKDLVGDLDDLNVNFYEVKNNVSGINSVIKKKENSVLTKKKQITLDNYCFKNNITPQIIKIDAEGYEYHILLGARNLLKLHKPKLVISFHPNMLKEIKIDETLIHKFFSEINYQIYDKDKKKVSKINFGEYIILPNES